MSIEIGTFTNLHISPKKLSFLRHLSKPYTFVPLDLNYELSNNEGDKTATLEEKIADLTQHNGREICEKNEVKTLLKDLAQRALRLRMVERLHKQASKPLYHPNPYSSS